MATKTMSKRASREAAEKAALKDRLRDLALGAHGGYAIDLGEETPDEFVGMASEMGLDGFGRWVGAIQTHLLDREQAAWLVKADNLHHFDTLDKATEHLWAHGVRP